jgi:hypothetical protein
MLKRRAALIMLAAAAALAAILAPSGASGADLRNCGDGVRAAIVECPKAKRIAKEYAETRDKKVQWFTCTAKRRGDEFKARCELDRKLILFSFRA